MAMQRWRPFGFADRWEPLRNLSDMQGEMNRLFETFVGRPAVGTMTVGSHVDAARRYVRDGGRPGPDRGSSGDQREGRFGVDHRRPAVHQGRAALGAGAKETKDNTVLHVERVYGQFERMIQLPIAVQADKVKATYRDGVLEVTLPKAEEVKPRAIKVDIL